MQSAAGFSVSGQRRADAVVFGGTPFSKAKPDKQASWEGEEGRTVRETTFPGSSGVACHHSAGKQPGREEVPLESLPDDSLAHIPGVPDGLRGPTPPEAIQYLADSRRNAPANPEHIAADNTSASAARTAAPSSSGGGDFRAPPQLFSCSVPRNNPGRMTRLAQPQPSCTQGKSRP